MRRRDKRQPRAWGGLRLNLDAQIVDRDGFHSQVRCSEQRHRTGVAEVAEVEA